MKKFFCIIVLFISVCVSGFAQTTVGEVKDGFKRGCFWIVVDSDLDNYSVMMFKTDYSTEKTDADGNVFSAVWETVVMSDDGQRGEDWFKKRMEDDDLRLIMGNELFYGNFKIVIDDDYTVTDEGRARVTMTLME